MGVGAVIVHPADPLIGDGQNRIGGDAQAIQRFLGVEESTPFEVEGGRGDHQNECPGFTCGPSDDRSRSRTGPASESGDDEDQSCSLSELADGRKVGLSAQSPDLRVAAGPEAMADRQPQRDLSIDRGDSQGFRAGVGVGAFERASGPLAQAAQDLGTRVSNGDEADRGIVHGGVG